jgi:hypothetical protein
MAIPSSGPLALTDVQTEFGGSNPIGINEYYAGGAYVPAGTAGTYGAVPSSGQISLQNFYGTSNVVYALNNIRNGYVIVYGLSIDSSNNIYVSTGYAGGDVTWVGKYDSNVNLLWQKMIGTSPINGYGGNIVDASGNLIVIGNNGGAANQWALVKLNPSGSVVWQQQCGPGSANVAPTGCNAIDASGNIYTTGRGYLKFNTDSTLIYNRQPSGSFDGGTTGIGVVTDSTDIIVHYRSQSTYMGTVRWTANGADRVWGRAAGNSGSFTSSFQSLAIMSNGNFVIVGFSSGSFTIAVVSQATGNTVWSNGLSSGNTFRNFGGVTVDSSNNIYATFSIGSPYQWVVVVKYNASGTIQWFRKIVANGYDAQTFPIKTDSSGNVIFCVNNDNGSLLCKIPTDGSKTGSWVINGITYTYAAETSCSENGAGQGWNVQSTSAQSFNTNYIATSYAVTDATRTNTKQVI